MKFLTQVVLPIAILVAVVGGVTFIWQYSGSPKVPPPQTGTGAISDELLRFPTRFGVWTAEDARRLAEENRMPETVAEFEVHSTGHYDFWFHNPTTAPVEIGLKYKSCTCADVKVGVLTPEGRREMATHGPAVVASLVLAGAGGADVLAPLAAENAWLQRVLDKQATWTPLDTENDSSAVIAGPGQGPAVGVVRLGWVGKQPQPIRLAAKLQPQQSGRFGSEIRLELPVAFVPPMRVDAETLQLREINRKDQKETAEFNCWSSTRDDFKFTTVKEEKGHPNFECTWRPLTDEERRSLANEHKTVVRCGYRVTVTAHERRGNGEPLDLDRIRRKIIVTGPADVEPLTVLLTGVVRGEVALRTADDKDYIDLGSFRASRGLRTKRATLVSEEPGLKLKLASWTPDYLKVALQPQGMVDGSQRWELTVEVPAGLAAGRLPADSAVILQTQGASRGREFCIGAGLLIAVSVAILVAVQWLRPGEASRVTATEPAQPDVVYRPWPGQKYENLAIAEDGYLQPGSCRPAMQRRAAHRATQ
jgi:hypothetical protein